VILEVDAGNSALKWRVIDADSGVLVSGRSLLSQGNVFTQLAVDFPCLQEAKFSCVAKGAVADQLAQSVFDLWGIRGQFAQTQKHCSGLTVAYDDPSRLGVDRWLAMLAAFHEVRGAVCVFDCGSAVTADFVTVEGLHQGGYIAPGLKMQRDALLSNTGQIRFENAFDSQQYGWGSSTEQAVGSGVVRMVVEFIDGVVDELLELDAPPILYLTGGDAELLLPLLKRSLLFEVRSELVMDGLVVALD
jgi:type III pantothenate kinase